jgi:hypothetical protein
MQKIVLTLLCPLFFIHLTQAQTDPSPQPISSSQPIPRSHPGYLSVDFNIAQFSIANVKNAEGYYEKLSIPRFTWMLNVGAYYNYDFTDYFGFYTGAEIKNLGVIIKTDGIKYKRRAYTLGIPLAFKLGRMKYADFFAGVEADRALQYQEKQKVGDSVQHRFGEWWSDRTPHVLFSWFIGVQLFHSSYIKIQSYTTNFFNQDFIDGGGNKPYANTIARPFLLSFGYTFNTNKNNRFKRGDRGDRHSRRHHR